MRMHKDLTFNIAQPAISFITLLCSCFFSSSDDVSYDELCGRYSVANEIYMFSYKDGTIALQDCLYFYFFIL